MNLDPALIAILACPDCRSTLRVDDAAGELVCTGCGLAYPVRDDIPIWWGSLGPKAVEATASTDPSVQRTARQIAEWIRRGTGRIPRRARPS